MNGAAPLLDVRHLSVRFGGASDLPPAVADISFQIRHGSVLALVGSSGAGKSLTALSILGLLPPGARASGEILFEGKDLLQKSEPELQAVRGRRIAIVFQDAVSSLSPVHSVGWQLALALQASGHLERVPFWRSLTGVARPRVRQLLRSVELPDPDHVLDLYPHQLSAGMRRRVLIALALACQPALLVADEPTTGLDGPIQAQILDLLVRLAKSSAFSALLITHDLCVAAEVASEIAVMNAGRIVESGPTQRVTSEPQHPYTASLLAGIVPYRPAAAQRRKSAELAEQPSP